MDIIIHFYQYLFVRFQDQDFELVSLFLEDGFGPERDASTR